MLKSSYIESYSRDDSPYQQINFCYFDIIKFSDSSSHMVFVCTQMCQEHQGVVVFNFLHGGFSSQWVFDNVEWVHAGNREKKNNISD